MKITRVVPFVLGTPWRNLTFVRVDTDDGLAGVGEARMLNHTDALLGYLQEAERNHILGSDPFAIEDLVLRMMVGDYAHAGEIAMSAIAVIEMACWDVVGKALGVPVYQLFGGAVRDRIKAYANGWYNVERTPQEFNTAARTVVQRGYRALKVDPFGAGGLELGPEELSRAIALVEAVRDAVGPEAELFIEMHGRFTPSTAVHIARELEPFKPAWIEEPVPPGNVAALRRVTEKVSIPVATGERLHTRASYRQIFELGAADIIQPDISHFGGMLETRKLAATAQTYEMLFAPHNVAGPVATAANLHVAACTPNFKIQEHFNDFADDWVKAAAPGTPEVIDGYFSLPSGAGLGVTLDEAFVGEHPRQNVFFSPFQEDWHKRNAVRPS